MMVTRLFVRRVEDRPFVKRIRHHPRPRLSRARCQMAPASSFDLQSLVTRIGRFPRLVHLRPATPFPYFFRMPWACPMTRRFNYMILLASPRGFEPLLPP